MTDIEKKAREVYPYLQGLDSINDRFYDVNWDKREGYIKASEEYESLQKINGWVVRDKDGIQGLSRLFFALDKPVKVNDETGEWWSITNPGAIDLPEELFPDITSDSEPVEVELLIKKK